MSHIAKAETAANRLKPRQFLRDSGRVEAVEPAHPGLGVGPVAGQGPKLALGRQQLGVAGDLLGPDRAAAQAGIAAEQGRDLVLALLRLPASRCNRPACRPA